MKVLINVSNHPSTGWSEEQKAGWDSIFDVQFPTINANWDTNDKDYQEAEHYVKSSILNFFETVFCPACGKSFYYPLIHSSLEKAIAVGPTIFLNLQGEYSICYKIYKWILQEKLPIRLVVPTTERQTVEEVQPDGTVKKTSVFKFVRWRVI